jgi:alpha-1,6-mannosyltransferase
MVFLDTNTFFVDKAGGIRTYHLAKIAWFRQHPEHTYVLVGPGPCRKEEWLAPNVLRVWLWGFAATPDPESYRVMLDLPGLLALLKRFRPSVVEAGDPWLSGPLLMATRALGLWRGGLTSFYHSDPVRTYFEPWADGKGAGSGAPSEGFGAHSPWVRKIRHGLAGLAAGAFHLLQRQYDLTLTSSLAMRDHLTALGVRTAHTPFGAPADFLAVGRVRPTPPSGPYRIVYAGRLHEDKGLELLQAILPRLLARTDLTLTVMGRGSLEGVFRAPELLAHPRYRFLAYLADRKEFLAEFSTHHLMIAPGPWETFGLGVLEALALGIPVVGPDRGGTGEMLRELGSDCLFPAGDAKAFAAAIDRCLAGDLGELSRRGRELALRYGSWDDAVAAMVRVAQERTAHG